MTIIIIIVIVIQSLCRHSKVVKLSQFEGVCSDGSPATRWRQHHTVLPQLVAVELPRGQLALHTQTAGLLWDVTLHTVLYAVASGVKVKHSVGSEVKLGQGVRY